MAKDRGMCFYFPNSYSSPHSCYSDTVTNKLDNGHRLNLLIRLPRLEHSRWLPSSLTPITLSMLPRG